jgi:hypothetical protein
MDDSNKDLVRDREALEENRAVAAHQVWRVAREIRRTSVQHGFEKEADGLSRQSTCQRPLADEVGQTVGQQRRSGGPKLNKLPLDFIVLSVAAGGWPRRIGGHSTDYIHGSSQDMAGLEGDQFATWRCGA